MIPVKLKDIVEELSFQSDEVSSLLNTKTGEVVSVADEELRAAENRAVFSEVLITRGQFRPLTPKIVDAMDHLTTVGERTAPL